MGRNPMNIRILFVLLAFSIQFSCATQGKITNTGPVGQRANILGAAQYLKQIANPPYYLVNGKYYHYDCSGFVMAVWDKAGIGLLRNMSYEKGENAVTSIYKHLSSKNKIFTDPQKAQIGDIVFFHNTYDRNRNRRTDDLFTHVGIVIGMEPDGTILFLNKTSKGIAEDRLNLRDPMIHKRYDKILNTYLRKRSGSDPHGTKYLAGELFACFGTF
jgi:cell wall-associated NlpC family hydrolase